MQASKNNNLLDNINHSNNAEIQNLVERVVHDICSPIAILEISIQHMEQNRPNLNIIRAAIQRLRDITNNMLNQYHGKQDSNFFILHNLLEEVASEKRYEWSEKKCEFILFLDPALNSHQLYINSCEFKRTLSNLLNNALEACKANPRIVLSTQQKNHSVEVSISDNGVGIPASKLDDYLLGKSTKHLRKGLGLSSAKQYLESIGGKLRIESKPNIGTTVTLQFNSRVNKG